MGPPTITDRAVAVPRIKATSTGFRLWLAQRLGAGNTHGRESLGYVMLDNNIISRDSRLQTGVLTLTSSSFTSLPVMMAENVGKRSWVFASIQSSNNGADPHLFMWSRPDRNNDVRGFVKVRASFGGYLKLESDEKTMRRRSPSISSEIVAWMAVDAGCSTYWVSSSNVESQCPDQSQTITIGDTTYDYIVGIRKSVPGKENTQTINFKRVFQSAPIMLAQIQTNNDADPCELRTRSITTSQYQYIIEEDKRYDREVRHASEWVAFMAIGKFR